MDAGQRQRKRAWLMPSKWLEQYTLWAYRRPLPIFFTIVTILVLLVTGMIAANSGSMSDTEGDEWTIKTKEHTKRDQAIEAAVDDLGSMIVQRPRSEDDGELKLVFVYTAQDDSKNMFSQENLEVMRKVENLVVNHEQYPNFCELNYTNEDPKCIDQLSPLRYFFGTNESSYGFGELTRSPEDGLVEIKKDLFTNGFFFTEDILTTNKSLHARSSYSFGLPVNNRTNRNDEDDDQREFVYDNFLKDVESELWDLLGMKSKLFRTEYSEIGSYENVRVLFHNYQLEWEEEDRAIMLDFTWAGLSILFVWIYMLIHLGSFFMSVIGIFEVFMAFPAAVFVYREIFSIDYFSQLNLVVIFVLMGIGADDVFVFMDAFKQSPFVQGVGPNLKDRLIYTSHRASKAVFVTSFTTAAAFFATAISELMPLRAFGIFAGLCIVFLFIINVLLMPVSLVIWSGYGPACVRKCCFCCIPCSESFRRYLPCCTCCHLEEDKTFGLSRGRPGKRTELQADYSFTADNARTNGAGDHHVNGAYENIMMEMTSQNGLKNLPDTSEEQNPVVVPKTSEPSDNVANMRTLERFFNGTYFNFIKSSRFCIIALGAVVLSIGVYQVTTFETPKEEESFWPEFHMYNKFWDLNDRDGPFLSDDEDAFTTVHLAWGLDGMDTSDRNVWDAKDFGTLVYDKSFNLTSKAAQQHLLDVCPQAREEQCSARDCTESCVDGVCEKFLVRFDRSKPDSYERCWIEDMDAFLKRNSSLNNTQGLPVEPEDFVPLLREYMKSSNAVIKFQEQIGLFDDGLRFVQFELDSTYRPPTSESRTRAVLNEWEDFMDKINNQAAAIGNGAENVSRGFQSGRGWWVWIFSQEALIDNAIQGVFLVFTIAFVVLNFATGNVIISSLAILTVVGVTTTVMGIGIRAIQDWPLGVAESIISVILIGFSMDYSLHLADAYIESERTGRMDRMQDSLTRLGISVTAGAITTMLSGVFLWGAIFTFFTKFAFNITVTVLASYLWSMLFFPSMCMTFGPEGTNGNWSTILSCLISCHWRERSRESNTRAEGQGIAVVDV